jgi:phosphoribosylformimino-5-aminoimidazole carboxamide ribotide isomerase
MHLLPAIDILDGKVVRLAKGDYNAVTVYNNSPVDQAKAFEDMGVEWIHVVDLNGAKSGNPTNLPLIEAILSKTLIKVEMGGGIRTMDTLQRIYDAGVSRVVLGTSLISNMDFTREAIAKFPTMLTAGVDARGGEVSVDGWNNGSGIAAEDLIAQMRDLGFKHLVYTDISKDGMQTGLDVDVYTHLAHVFGNPVIASGGVASVADIERLTPVAGSIEGVITGRAVYEGTLDVPEALLRCKQATAQALAGGMQACSQDCGGCNAY